LKKWDVMLVGEKEKDYRPQTSTASFVSVDRLKDHFTAYTTNVHPWSYYEEIYFEIHGGAFWEREENLKLLAAAKDEFAAYTGKKILITCKLPPSLVSKMAGWTFLAGAADYINFVHGAMFVDPANMIDSGSYQKFFDSRSSLSKAPTAIVTDIKNLDDKPQKAWFEGLSANLYFPPGTKLKHSAIVGSCKQYLSFKYNHKNVYAHLTENDDFKFEFQDESVPLPSNADQPQLSPVDIAKPAQELPDICKAIFQQLKSHFDLVKATSPQETAFVLASSNYEKYKVSGKPAPTKLVPLEDGADGVLTYYFG